MQKVQGSLKRLQNHSMQPNAMEASRVRYLVKEIVDRYYTPDDPKRAEFFGLDSLESYHAMKEKLDVDDSRVPQCFIDDLMLEI